VEGWHIHFARPSNSSALNSDYFVWRGQFCDFNNSGVTIQNCLFEGNEGAGKGENTEGIAQGDTMAHPDFFQNQNPQSTTEVTMCKFLRYDNCVLRNGVEGTVIQRGTNNGVLSQVQLKYRNCDMKLTNEYSSGWENVIKGRGGFGIPSAHGDTFPLSAYNAGAIEIINTKYSNQGGSVGGVGGNKNFGVIDNDTKWLRDPLYQSLPNLIGNSGLTWYDTSIPIHTEFVARDGTGLGPGYVSPWI
jgi:hypothetical protein